MGEQNNMNTQNESKNPIATGCGCLFLALVLLHVLSTPIKRIIEFLFGE